MRTTIALVGALMLMALPTGVGHSTLPLNFVTNGGFETGAAGWGTSGTGSLTGPLLVTPGAEATSTAMLIREVGAGSAWMYQDHAAAAALPVALLDFSARVQANANNPMPNSIMVIAAHNPVTGQAEITARVDFYSGQAFVTVYCNGLLGACVFTPIAYPQDGAFHHYQLVLVAGIGVGVMLIDGLPAGVIVGNPGSVQAPTRLLFGDIAFHVRGLAPDVAWDEIYFGPTL